MRSEALSGILAERRGHGSIRLQEHVKKLVKEQIIWAPAIAGAFVLTRVAVISTFTSGRTSRSSI
jgi:uncharacterized linocin/CFP29 family protein